VDTSNGYPHDEDLDDIHLDANAMAGVLQQIFVSEFTTFRRVCQSCGDHNAVGACRSYMGAGIVLRCPNCGDIALRVSPRDQELVLELRGTWRIATTGGLAVL
jgi:hypothetical protein